MNSDTPQSGDESVMDIGGSARSSRPHRRTPMACTNCRRRKIKCTPLNEDTCRNCHYRELVCVFQSVAEEEASKAASSSASSTRDPDIPSSSIIASPVTPAAYPVQAHIEGHLSPVDDHLNASSSGPLYVLNYPADVVNPLSSYTTGNESVEHAHFQNIPAHNVAYDGTIQGQGCNDEMSDARHVYSDSSVPIQSGRYISDGQMGQYSGQHYPLDEQANQWQLYFSNHQGDLGEGS
ncbi:hypothetical protein AX17_000899 [Amanita inopinata Kibby_2008]|nr:hypothetical protein AX17_000899 [Amanita inopinata Kibby_2008]